MAKSSRWEGSAADRAADKRAAKKRGISVKKYEGSAADRKTDAAARKRRKKKTTKK